MRRGSHDEASFEELERTLTRFHTLRTVFEDVGVRPDGFSLPRQHSLVHYIRGIKMFGSPNGLCSSITESRHITAVKRPWRRSNRYNAMGQMLVTNTRLSKIAAARVEFGRRGMIHGDVLTAARIGAGLEDDVVVGFNGDRDAQHAQYQNENGSEWLDGDGDGDATEYTGPTVTSFFRLAKKPSKLLSMYCGM